MQKLNRKQIRKNAWNNTFRRGFSAWAMLAIVCVIFAVLGVYESSEIAIFDVIDKAKGTEQPLLLDNVDVVETYLKGTPLAEDFFAKMPVLTRAFFDSISRNNTWLVRLLGANMAYLQRNSAEVIVTLFIAAILSFLFHFFIQSTLIIGEDRYALECRYSRKVPIDRIIAPFHKKNILHLILTIFLYRLTVTLWSLTIVGGFYKMYQYRFVSWILAENPSLRWTEVKKLSARMTDGYKWQLFFADVSCLHIQFLRMVPFCGILVTVPFETQYYAEQYILLRGKISDEFTDFFIEPVFGGKTYLEGNTAEPKYRLASVVPPRPADLLKKSRYSLVEYLYMFILFSFIGWLWEVGLHFFQFHEFANRGTLYGPWIPIYGTGGVLMLLLLDRFRGNVAKFFLLSVLVCGVLEYWTSWYLDFFYNSTYWDYKNMLVNLNGRICLSGLLVFGIGGIIVDYIAAPIISFLLRRGNKKAVNIICILLCAAFAFDQIYSLLFGFNSGSGVGGTF